MKGWLRSIVPARLRLRVKKALGLPATRLHPHWAMLRLAGPVLRPHVVLDVGAHHGWFFHCWLDWCPEAEIHAFEPAPDAFRIATELYGADRRVHLVRAGVSAVSGELALRIFEGSQVSNSFLQPATAVWDSIEYHLGAARTCTVPVLALDDYCCEQQLNQVHLLKIDVQGYELEVLRGAGKVLPKVDYVFVESGIRRLYLGAPSFADTFLALETAGFHLVHMRAWHRGNRVLMEGDMLFRRNGLEGEITRQTDREYLELRPEIEL